MTWLIYCTVNIQLKALALAELEAVAKLVSPAGPLNFTTPEGIIDKFERSEEPPGKLAGNEEAPALDIADDPASCCP